MSADAYNAVVVEKRDVAEDLFLLRVRPEGGEFSFKAGQFAVLGLRADHPRAASCAPEDVERPPEKIIRRAYSICSPDTERRFLDFLIAVVREGALTPRLMTLKKGDRLWLGPKAAGTLALDAVPLDMDVVMISTGTGIAPYMSMLRSALAADAARRFVVIHGARRSYDLTFHEELLMLERAHPQHVIYIPTLTRATPEEQWTGHEGRVQSVIEDGTAEARMGRAISPARDHVFLCGNPRMVDSMTAMFEARGFRRAAPRQPGNLHAEKFW